MISHSVKSVFDGVNKWTEALDIFKKYQSSQERLTRGGVEKVKILGMAEPISLADIYYPTKISTTIHRRLYAQEWHSIENQKNHILEKRKAASSEDGEKYVDRTDHTVVLAGPGSGKTTFLKHLALVNSDKDLFKKTALSKRRVPFYLHLPLLNPEVQGVFDYLVERLKKEAGDYAEQYIIRKLEKGDAIVLLDSLDEVPERHKALVVQKLQEFCERFQKAKIVISCRIADYEQPINNCYEVEIARLSPEAVRKIVLAWFGSDKSKSKKLLGHLESDQDLAQLTSTPLLLSLLCIQFKNDLDIPKRKVELYRRCIDALLKTWDTSRNFRRDTKYSSLTDDRKTKLFEKISREYIDKDFSYIFDARDLEGKVRAIIESFGSSGEDSSNIINEIESHHGVLERNSAETFLFCHPSFQEYFCAREIVASRSEMFFLKAHLENPSAYQIITFVSALLDDAGELSGYLKEKSSCDDIKTYPAMAKRTVILHLLYKVINSGVILSKEERVEFNKHLVLQQFNISKVYMDGGVYPFAIIEPDGVRHAYYYKSKRQTLYAALQPLRKFANDILLSPSSDYSDFVVDAVKDLNMDMAASSEGILSKAALTLCLTYPLASSRPEFVNDQIEFLKGFDLGVFFKESLSGSQQVLRKHYMH